MGPGAAGVVEPGSKPISLDVGDRRCRVQVEPCPCPMHRISSFSTGSRLVILAESSRARAGASCTMALAHCTQPRQQTRGLFTAEGRCQGALAGQLGRAVWKARKAGLKLCNGKSLRRFGSGSLPMQAQALQACAAPSGCDCHIAITSISPTATPPFGELPELEVRSNLGNCAVRDSQVAVLVTAHLMLLSMYLLSAHE